MTEQLSKVVYYMNVLVFTLYIGAVIVFVYNKRIEHEEQSMTGALFRRSLEGFNETECVFPRPDGTYPPNPLCRDLASFITSTFFL
jgi:hypothetical protein